MNKFIENTLRQCGGILIDLYRKGRTGGAWVGDQFKADADRIAHDFLSNRIHSSFPGIPVVSEENDVSIAQKYNEYFIIDPIDGTASFAHGFPGWVTQMAYVINEAPVHSGVYVPVTDEYFEADKNHGAYCNKQRLIIGGISENIRTIIDNYPQAKGVTLELLNDLNIPSYIESGSIALKICRIADDTADLFFKAMEPKDWDLAAPKLILEEAGGILRDAYGDEIKLGKSSRHHHGLIATKNLAMLEQVSDWYRSRK
mgnify:FL=1